MPVSCGFGGTGVTCPPPLRDRTLKDCPTRLTVDSGGCLSGVTGVCTGTGRSRLVSRLGPVRRVVHTLERPVGVPLTGWRVGLQCVRFLRGRGSL